MQFTSYLATMMRGPCLVRIIVGLMTVSEESGRSD